MKQYSFNGLAGCVQQRKARQTETLVGVYHGEQAGMGDGWFTVCEEHSRVTRRTRGDGARIVGSRRRLAQKRHRER